MGRSNIACVMFVTRKFREQLATCGPRCGILLQKVETQEGKCASECKRKGRWRLRCSGKIHRLYRDLNIVDGIKNRRLIRAGHIVRMEDESIPEWFLMGNCTTKYQWDDQE